MMNYRALKILGNIRFHTKRLLNLLVIVVITLSIAVSGCAGQDIEGKGPIIVGSKIDTEGALLSQIIILMLSDNGFQVVDKSEFGPTDLVRDAIISGELDIYPEYTGNGAFFFYETESAKMRQSSLRKKWTI